MTCCCRSEDGPGGSSTSFAQRKKPAAWPNRLRTRSHIGCSHHCLARLQLFPERLPNRTNLPVANLGPHGLVCGQAALRMNDEACCTCTSCCPLRLPCRAEPLVVAL